MVFNQETVQLTVAIRELCRKIVKEKGPEKTQLLIAELRQTLSVESDETRLRLGYAARLLKNKQKAIPKSDATD